MAFTRKQERRAFLRIPVRLRIDETARTLSFYYSKDVSTEGISLETNMPLPVGTRVFLDFTLPEGQGRIALWGRTVWSRNADGEKPGGMGIHFESIPGEMDRRLTAFVESLS